MKFIMLILMATSLYLPGFTQKQGQALIDSLEAELPKMKEDSNKAKVLNRIAQTYEWVNPLKCFPYAERGLKLSEKLNWKRGIANFNNNLGLY